MRAGEEQLRQDRSPRALAVSSALWRPARGRRRASRPQCSLPTLSVARQRRMILSSPSCTMIGMRLVNSYVGILFVLASGVATAATAQSAPGYPVRPTPLPQAEEIALARSAAPPEVADHAAV